MIEHPATAPTSAWSEQTIICKHSDSDAPPLGPTHRHSKSKTVTFTLPAARSPRSDSSGRLSPEYVTGPECVSPVGLGVLHGPCNDGLLVCPCCGTETLSGIDSKVASAEGSCDNRGWGWRGEPTFCCLCASRRGMGRLSKLGCDTCKDRRKKLYKRRTMFGSDCKHCGLHRSEHENAHLHTYPRCPLPARDL